MGGIARICSNMNALRSYDFVEVPRRGLFDPFSESDDHRFFSACQLSKETFIRPGVYRLRFTYSSQSSDIREWLGDYGRWAWRQKAADSELLELFSKVPKTTVVSNEITIRILR